MVMIVAMIVYDTDDSHTSKSSSNINTSNSNNNTNTDNNIIFSNIQSVKVIAIK